MDDAMSKYDDLVRRLREHKGSGFNRFQDAADAIEELQRDAERYRWLRIHQPTNTNTQS